jgi:FO synthase
VDNVVSSRPTDCGSAVRRLLDRASEGVVPSPEDAALLAGCTDLDALMRTAGRSRDIGHGDVISYSKKVFIPLTQLCRDICSYCSFAQKPRAGKAAYLTRDEVLAIARAGRAAGCKEALFTLGDKPELRYKMARDELTQLGCDTTISYLREMAAAVLSETGLLPHLNPGLLDLGDIEALRPVSASMGIMLETSAERLSKRGGPHFGSPDKHPARRLATIAAAGEAAVPFTSGLLIGIGETRAERVDALLALREINTRYGHLQEIIIQNFCAKPDTRMAAASDPSFDDHLWTLAVARIVLGPQISIQAPPNLSAGALPRMIAAGINDWGGVSPVTPDHVNPEKPWPLIEALEAQTARAGKVLAERLAVYPAYANAGSRWLDEAVRPAVLRLADASGLARVGAWKPGAADRLDGLDARHSLRSDRTPARDRLERVLAKAGGSGGIDEGEIEVLFAARGDDFWRVCEAADALRRQVSGDRVAYVVNRNINYTNVCYFHCQFCAFSKGKRSENLRGPAYNLDLDEVRRRVIEAWDRGATEVCLQGGIHPEYTGATYLSILRAIKQAVPAMHVHAFSPLEVWQGALTLSLSVEEFLHRLRQEGLGSLPGTAAEILDDEVRQVICADKLTTDQWLHVMRAAHETGLRSTATIMFGHVDRPVHWARHLLRIRTLQLSTGGFTEFVPLPFVPMETPIYLKGRSRGGPTLREAILMHAVARLALHGAIPNIQVSWVKMGPDGARHCLNAGANDMGGTLMNESITRAAGAVHGQEMAPDALDRLIRNAGRVPGHRTSLYAEPPLERIVAAYAAKPLQATVLFSRTKRSYEPSRRTVPE